MTKKPKNEDFVAAEAVEITIPEDLSTVARDELENLADSLKNDIQIQIDIAKESTGSDKSVIVSELKDKQAAYELLQTEIVTRDEQDAALNAELDALASNFSEADADEDADVEADAEADADEAADADEDAESDADDEETSDAEAEADKDETDETAELSNKTFNITKRRKADKTIPSAKETKMTEPKRFDFMREATQALASNPRTKQVIHTYKSIDAPEATMDRFANTKLMRKVATDAAAKNSQANRIMAAGGFHCGLNDQIREIRSCGSLVEPVGDALGRITTRGPVEFMKALSLSDVIDPVTGGVIAYTNADDLEDVTKNCYSATCATPVTGTPVAVPACFTWGNGQKWSNPELILDIEARMEVAAASIRESIRLQRIHEESIKSTWAPPVGESLQNGLIRRVGELLQFVGSPNNGRHDTSGYTLILSEQLLLQLLTDAAIKAWVGPTLTRDRIVGTFQDLFNVDVLVAKETRTENYYTLPNAGDLPAVSALDTALPCPKNQLEFILADLSDYAEADHDVEISVSTSIDEAKQNRQSMFSEIILQVEKYGCKPSFSNLYDQTAVTGSQPDLVAADADYCPDPSGENFPGVLDFGA